MRILIIEDEPKTGEYLRQGLGESGYFVDLAITAADGRFLFAEGDLDLDDEKAEVAPMTLLNSLGLFLVTAIAEIVGCYLPYLWLKGKAAVWVLGPSAAALVLFVWLLSLHPTAAGRVYAAYGGVYVATALIWLWLVDGVRPTAWDIAGSLVAITGMFIIMFGAKA